MKKIFAAIIIILMMTFIKINAFSTDSFSQNSSFKNYVEKNLEEYGKEKLAIDKEVQNAFASIIPILSGQSEAESIIKEINSTDSKINQIMNDYSTMLNNNRPEMVEIMKSLSNKEKMILAENTNTITQAGKKYLELDKKNLNLADNTIKKAKIKDERTTLLQNINQLTSNLTQSAKTSISLGRELKITAALSGMKF